MEVYAAEKVVICFDAKDKEIQMKEGREFLFLANLGNVWIEGLRKVQEKELEDARREMEGYGFYGGEGGSGVGFGLKLIDFSGFFGGEDEGFIFGLGVNILHLIMG